MARKSETGKEIAPSEVKVGDSLWGWWDWTNDKWYKRSSGLLITSCVKNRTAKGTWDVCAGPYTLTFGPQDRLLVAVTS